jgi:hypothetical protein
VENNTETGKPGEWGGDDFGITSSESEEGGGGTGDKPSAPEVIDPRIAERKKRMEELGVIEQANVANYKNGLIGISNLQ